MISSHRNFGKPIMSIFGFSDFTLYLMGQTNAKDVKLRYGKPENYETGTICKHLIGGLK